MEYINLNKTIELNDKIQDLLLISIDEKLDTIEDKDGVRIAGKVSIGGNTLTAKGEETFSDFIDIDIFLSYEEIEERTNLKVTVNDFNYKIEENKLHLDISVAIDGLKEIIQTFLSQEDNEFDEEKEIVEDKGEENEEIIEKSETFELEERIEDKIISIDENEESSCIEKINDVNEKEVEIEELQIKESINEKKSLLKSVFSNKRIKEEVSWRLHCVKEEKSYEEIANKYNVNLTKLMVINKNEKLEEGKLIFLPLE